MIRYSIGEEKGPGKLLAVKAGVFVESEQGAAHVGEPEPLLIRTSKLAEDVYPSGKVACTVIVYYPAVMEESKTCSSTMLDATLA